MKQILPKILFVILLFQMKTLVAQWGVDSLHLKIPGDQLYASWSPDGKQMLYQSNARGNWDIFLFSLKTGKSQPLTNDLADEQHPVWVPGKDAVVFERGKGRTTYLYLLQLRSHNEKRLIPRAISCREASFTPSRHLVAFSGWDAISESWQLFTYDFIYDNLNQLTHEDGDVFFPVFDPQGKVIHYLLNGSTGRAVLHAVNWYGQSKIIKRGITPGRIGWMLNGWRFYGICHETGQVYRICSWFRDGTKPRVLKISRKTICYPVLSPDGKQITYSKETENGFDIFVSLVQDY